MTTTIQQTEAAPASYPALTPAVPDYVWQRIEAYVAYRWTERAVVWVAEGMGWWTPPLTPATITTTEVWRNGAWEDAELSVSPLGGYCLPGGTYRFSGKAGGGTVPADVAEAVQRLSAYMAQKPGKGGATSESVSAGSVSISTRRSASWMAQAIANSGAGDLLRNYRRA
jgi:hypothetical protein